MFKCTKCGIVPTHIKEFRVVSAIRKVKYLNQIRYDKLIIKDDSSKIVASYKTVKETEGTEIVKEESYCKEHIPKNPHIEILDEVQKINLIGIKRAYRGEN